MKTSMGTGSEALLLGLNRNDVLERGWGTYTRVGGAVWWCPLLGAISRSL